MLTALATEENQGNPLLVARLHLPASELFLACVQTLQSVRRSEEEKKAPCRVCATATNFVFRVLKFCGTIWDWLHHLTIVLTCVQHIFSVTNIILKCVTSRTR